MNLKFSHDEWGRTTLVDRDNNNQLVGTFRSRGHAFQAWSLLRSIATRGYSGAELQELVASTSENLFSTRDYLYLSASQANELTVAVRSKLADRRKRGWLP